MTMSRRPRRNHSAIFKAKVAVEAIKADKTLSELAKAYDVHPNCVFRKSVTDRFGIVTAEFGTVTDHFGDVTDGVFVTA